MLRKILKIILAYFIFKILDVNFSNDFLAISTFNSELKYIFFVGVIAFIWYIGIVDNPLIIIRLKGKEHYAYLRNYIFLTTFTDVLLILFLNIVFMLIHGLESGLLIYYVVNSAVLYMNIIFCKNIIFILNTRYNISTAIILFWLSNIFLIKGLKISIYLYFDVLYSMNVYGSSILHIFFVNALLVFLSGTLLEKLLDYRKVM